IYLRASFSPLQRGRRRPRSASPIGRSIKGRRRGVARAVFVQSPLGNSPKGRPSAVGMVFRRFAAGILLLAAACNHPQPPAGEVTEVRIPRGAGGVGFLPLLVMENYALIERQAREAGIQNLQVRWIDLGGPAVMNDALLSGAVDFI